MSDYSNKHLDVDKVLRILKEKYPQKQIDREWLCSQIGTSYQNLVNYKMGKLPKVVLNLDKLIDLTGMPFKDLIVDKSKKQL